MATPRISNEEPYLNKDRVKNPVYPELIICSICKGILWLPKACDSCETPYCSPCMKNWQLTKSIPIPCPNTCSSFSERRCPVAVLYILSRLEVRCRYEICGCNETLLHNSLETHEEECGYRPIACRGCEQEIAKKDFKSHKSTCSLVLLTCSECNSIYKRQDETKHTETKCLREQLIQQKDKINQFENRMNSPAESFKQLM